MKRGLDLVKRFEGLELKAYRDSVGVLTIGYGHTIGVTEGQKITESQADALLLMDFSEAQNRVLNALEVKLNSNQIDALTSFVFNLGIGNFKQSTLLKKINKGESLVRKDLNYDPLDFGLQIPVYSEFHRWVYAGGKILKGLIRRREAEWSLYND